MQFVERYWWSAFIVIMSKRRVTFITCFSFISVVLLNSFCPFQVLTSLYQYQVSKAWIWFHILGLSFIAAAALCQKWDGYLNIVKPPGIFPSDGQFANQFLIFHAIYISVMIDLWKIHCCLNRRSKWVACLLLVNTLSTNTVINYLLVIILGLR